MKSLNSFFPMDPKVFSSFDLPLPKEIIPLAGGANNRVFKLDFNDRPSLVYKQYFQHPNDPRPRLQAEFSFLQYAWNLGLRNIPQPIHFHLELNSALYTYIPGKHLQKSDITNHLIQQKVEFFLSLNTNKTTAGQLPSASEACFSIDSYLKTTTARIERITQAEIESPLKKDLQFFIHTHLLPKWDLIHERACKAALHYPYLTQEEKCISPSDFGFHNALLGPDDTLYFIDFEYAGWDDPCKTICDLFCQPRIPIPEDYFPLLSTAIASSAKHPEKCLIRLEIIRPIMQIKWCCILLNTFTHVGKYRRQFSQSEELERQEKQLQMAKEQLNKTQI